MTRRAKGELPPDVYRIEVRCSRHGILGSIERDVLRSNGERDEVRGKLLSLYAAGYSRARVRCFRCSGVADGNGGEGGPDFQISRKHLDDALDVMIASGIHRRVVTI